MSREPLGPLELDVFRFVAERQGASVREAAEHFAETTGQARTTVLTVMERLRTKGYLGRRKAGGVHRYTPKVALAEVLESLVGNFVADVLGGSMSPFVAYLAQSPELTEA